MPSVIIDERFRGPPNSGNGGYVCGLLAKHVAGGMAEITLRAPPPLGQPLEIVASAEGAVDLRAGETIIAVGRQAHVDLPEISTVSCSEAEHAVRCTPFNEDEHNFPMCFVCGPARAHGDGLRLFAGPLAARADRKTGAFAASWIPNANLADDDGLIATEFVWASLDCPTAYAGVGSGHWGLAIGEPILLGRMSARINGRPRPGEQCIVVTWPMGRDGRKLFADGALLRATGEVLAVARTTWLQVDAAKGSSRR